MGEARLPCVQFSEFPMPETHAFRASLVAKAALTRAIVLCLALLSYGSTAVIPSKSFEPL